jgi:hypothetical protein
MELMCDTLSFMRKCQAERYCFVPVLPLISYFLKLERSSPNDSYRMSLQIEPRENK